MTAPAPTARRRFVTGTVIGGALAFVVFAAVLTITGGHPDLLRRDIFGNFFDAQAKSLLHGHWDVPKQELFIEGFVVGGKTYTYFGVWPSLLRMPVLAVVPALYGRLTQLSMLLAFGTLAASLGAVHWRIRELVRPGRPCGRVEPALVTFACCCGSTVLWLASRSLVYHEAILWGIGLSLLAYERILTLIARPSMRTLALASGGSTVAFLARASVGLGPVIALGLVVAGQLLALARPHLAPIGLGRAARGIARLDWLGVADRGGSRPRPWFAACLGAALLPVLAYTSVNYSRFGSPTGIPWKNQAFVSISAENRRVLAENGNTYFGVQFAPTTALQYLRPDALAPDRLFPWVTFPHARARVVGGVALIERTVATSAPASMPALVFLGVFGTLAAAWPRFARTRAVAALRAPLVGSAAAVVPVITVAYVGNRYLGDFVPLLLLAGLVGLQTLLRRREEARSRRPATVGLAIAAALATFGVWVNFSLALDYQRLYMPASADARRGFLGFQYDLDALFGGRPRAVVFSDSLPAEAATAGTTVVVGNCDGLYWSDGVAWHAIEGRRTSGWFPLRITVPPNLGPGWQPLLATGAPGRQLVVGAHERRHQVELGLGQVAPDGTLQFRASDQTVGTTSAPGRHDLDVLVGGPLSRVTAFEGGRTVLDVALGAPPTTQPFELARADTPGVAPRFAGRVRLRSPQLALCEGLVERHPDARAAPRQARGALGGRLPIRR